MQPVEPFRSSSHKRSGDAFLGEGKLDEAAGSYRLAIAANRDDAEAHLNLGFVLSEQQRYEEAERSLKQALAINPAMADALYILGVISKAQGNAEDAINSFTQAIEYKPDFEIVPGDLCELLFQSGQPERGKEVILKGLALYPQNADFHAFLGNLCAAENDTDQAIKCFQSALLIRPDQAPVHNSFGVLLAGLNRHDEALGCYDLAIQYKPNYLEAYNNRGVCLAELEQAEAALASYGDALRLQPDNLDVLSNRAILLLKNKRYAGALVSYDKLLQLQPCCSEWLCNRGRALGGLGRHEEELTSYDQALEFGPDSADVHFNRGNALASMNRTEEALASYDRALVLKPNDVDALCNRGNVLRRLKRIEEALACYDQLLQTNPNSADGISNRGAALSDLHRYDEALECFARAQQIQPDHVDAHFHECSCRLLLGEYEMGWPLYEWRWRVSGQEKNVRHFKQPLWLGKEPLHDKTILLHAEQGFGDTIQFCRYAKIVAATGAKVLLEVQAPLKPLLTGLEGVSQIVIKGQSLPAFDYQCPLLSLPLALDTRLNTIPADTPYISSDLVRVNVWRTKLGKNARPRIGLAWSGNPAQMSDYNRSIPLDTLSRLISEQAQFVCLQKEFRRNDLQILEHRKDIAFFGDDLVDFAETAALISNLDLVISVCTSIAHLAGAMGKPVWLLLSYNADWRWLLDRSDSPWYPSARLFRQSENGDWEGVISTVATELEIWRRRLDSGSNGHSSCEASSPGGSTQ
ncbi:MAG: tetratricopeptide repeat protein [Propionivibrio sp.]|nr:tetratricopeptide repeat protein [Propionivibrio sp.]